MKGREGKGPPSADLLACFPSRAHLTLMAPKPICSPSRPSEPATRHRRHRQTQNHHHMRNASKRGRGGGHASPLIWAKTKSTKSDISEPTSPKVTCAGQIKVRPKTNSCKSWQSVMEEIERLHNRNKKKKLAWAEALGFKKDVMNFLTCLRNIRFDFRCFGSFQNAEITSDDDEDDEEEEETFQRNFQVESKEESDDHNESSRAFAKWFMILQENTQSAETEEGKKGNVNRPYYNEEEEEEYVDGDDDGPCAPPPPNALLLMRCRSAPAKSWLEEKEEEEKREREDDHEEKLKEEQKMKTEETERLVVMRCGTDFSKFSCDIAKETWVVGGIKDMLSRSRSSKR